MMEYREKRRVQELDKGVIAVQPIDYDWEVLGKACRRAIEAIKDACDIVSRRILIPFYDNCLLAASSENPKWYYYYKNAKKSRTREKYRALLQNRFLQLLAEKGNQ